MTTPDEFAERIAKLSQGGMDKVVERVLVRAGLRGERSAKQSLTNSGDQRTGNLRSSIRHKVEDGELRLQAGGRARGVDVVYAAIQEYGGTIRPRSAQWLAIPISNETRTPAGVARYASARDYPEPLAFIMSKKGNALLIDPETGTPHYALVKEVTIKGRGYLQDGARGARREILQKLPTALAEAISGNL